MLYKCFVFTGVFVNVIHLLYILSEIVGEPTIHEFCEHTYAHQWEFPSTTKIIYCENNTQFLRMFFF